MRGRIVMGGMGIGYGQVFIIRLGQAFGRLAASARNVGKEMCRMAGAAPTAAAPASPESQALPPQPTLLQVPAFRRYELAKRVRQLPHAESAALEYG